MILARRCRWVRCTLIAMAAASAVIWVLLTAPCAAADTGADALADRPDPTTIKTQLADILSDSRYETAEDDSALFARVLQSVVESLLEFIDRIFGTRVRSLITESPLLYWILVSLLIILLVAIMFHLIYGLAAAFREKKAIPDASVVAPSLSVSPASLMDRARRSAAEGDFATATVSMYVAVLHELHRQGRIRYADSETNRQMARQVQQEDLRSALMTLTGAVDAILYGSRPGSSDTYERAAALATEVTGS
ncbi:MAG: DUF4129 domain-containing protein [Armatimonadota bacterium]